MWATEELPEDPRAEWLAALAVSQMNFNNRRWESEQQQQQEEAVQPSDSNNTNNDNDSNNHVCRPISLHAVTKWQRNDFMGMVKVGLTGITPLWHRLRDSIHPPDGLQAFDTTIVKRSGSAARGDAKGQGGMLARNDTMDTAGPTASIVGIRLESTGIGNFYNPGTGVLGVRGVFQPSSEGHYAGGEGSGRGGGRR